MLRHDNITFWEILRRNLDIIIIIIIIISSSSSSSSSNIYVYILY